MVASEVVNVVNEFSEEEMENYLLAIYTGLITTRSLSYDYHERVGGKLYQGVLDGFGGIRFSELEASILKGLTNNIYVFAAAKQYTQVREISGLIDDKITFSDFKKQGGSVFEDYNKNYLATELDTSITQSQNARKWAKIQAEKEIFPLLQYKTQNDGLVRASHAALHNIIKPVNDPFWNNNMPANGWHCRCFTQQLENGEVTTDVPELSEEDQPELFRMNPGKDKYIFNPGEHPYFSVAKWDADFRDNNYNLPTP
jgi:SPP1 gp7 family putative phage head morphogenesis protein